MQYSDPHIQDSSCGSPRARLLVVDDDAYMRELYALVLNLEGYDVGTACDGAAALELLAVEAFDLVLTDRGMPNLDGASMVLAMRSAGIAIPVVMVTGTLAQAPLSRGVAREISVIVPKPAQAAKILSAVAQALSGTAQPGSHQHPGKPREHGAQPSAGEATPGPVKSSFARGWSQIFTSIVLHIRPVSGDATAARLRSSPSLEPLTSPRIPGFRL